MECLTSSNNAADCLIIESIFRITTFQTNRAYTWLIFNHFLETYVVEYDYLICHNICFLRQLKKLDKYLFSKTIKEIG